MRSSIISIGGRAAAWPLYNLNTHHSGQRLSSLRCIPIVADSDRTFIMNVNVWDESAQASLEQLMAVPSRDNNGNTGQGHQKQFHFLIDLEAARILSGRPSVLLNCGSLNASVTVE